MAQAFQTIYNRNYRKHAYSKRELILPEDEFANRPPAEGNWRIVTEENKISGRSRKDLEEQVDAIYAKRYKSIYTTSYCHAVEKDEFHDSDQECENELINRAGRVFKKKTKKISPPLGTSRRLWGYMRPNSLYAPLSTYQHTYDRIAFKLLREGMPKDDDSILEDNQKHPVDSHEDAAEKHELTVNEHQQRHSLVEDETPEPALKQKWDKLVDGLLRSQKTKKTCRGQQQSMMGNICGKRCKLTVINS